MQRQWHCACLCCLVLSGQLLRQSCRYLTGLLCVQDAELPSHTRVEDAYLWEGLGSADAGQDVVPDQQFDQSEAFEYCLHLYNSVPEVRASKAGSYIV